MTFSEWPLLPIGEVATGIYDGPHATPVKTKDGPVFLGIESLSRGRLDLTRVEHLSEIDFVRWTRRVTPQPDDLVFSYETRLGEAALIPKGLRCCLGRRMALIRPDTAKIDPRFLLYYFLGPEFQEVVRSRTIHGSTVDRIPLKEFPNFPVRVPPMLEQRRIGNVLGVLDEKITLNRRMSQTLEAMARAIFKSWFVDDESGVGARKFTSVEVYDIATVIYGAPFSSALFNEAGEGLPLIRIRDLLSQSPGIYTTEEHPKGRVIVPGEILVGMDGEFKARIWCGPPSWLNQRVCCFEPKPGVPRAFLLFSIEEPLAYFERSKTGTTVIHLGKADIDTFRFLLPPLEILRKFDELTSPMLDRIVANEAESCTLAALRDALLPKLLAGEIRVKQAEKIVGEVV